MRRRAGAGMIAGTVVLVACGGSAGSPSEGASASVTVPSAGNCAAGHAEVTVAPGDAPRREVCVRPGTVLSLVLRPRVDDRRWTGVRSSAPAFAVVSGRRLDADGTAHASLRCAGTRGGSTVVTVTAKAPDVAGAARVAFTLDVSVVPYPRQG
ncbi:hypothetical protein [Streptomyces sp. NPDC058457]|uniref:hypothetical protein n=1 Tax=Streptomyces sp. NPDC058457 TaxID=3346507 RepID=UPI0036666336